MVHSLLPPRQRGFSLLELSIIIMIASTIAVGYLTWTKPDVSTTAENLQETKRKMAVVESAIYQFRTKYGRLPCPANPETRDDQTSAAGGAPARLYGEEDLQTTANTVTCPVSWGTVPVTSLAIHPTYMYDGWGRRLFYRVSDTLCGSLTGYGCSAQSYRDNVGNILVTDSAGNTISNEVAYVLISYGKNGNGAYMPSGSQNPAPASNNELENTDTDAGTPPVRFVQGLLVTSPSTAYFDDIVDFITKDILDNKAADMLTPTVTIAECLSNRNWLRGLTANDAQRINNATNYALGKDDDIAILQISWALQDACDKQYGATGITPDMTWTGKQCPGGAAAGAMYDPVTETCNCASGLWNDNC